MHAPSALKLPKTPTRFPEDPKNLGLDELTVAGGEGISLRRRALRQLVRTSVALHR